MRSLVAMVGAAALAVLLTFVVTPVAASESCCGCACEPAGSHGGEPAPEIIACSAAPFGEGECDAACVRAGRRPSEAQPACSDGACSDPTCPAVCPTTEVGFCTDGLDNEPDGLTDCADPDCTGDLGCRAAAPVMGHVTSLLLVLALSGLAAVRLSRRRTPAG